MQLTICYCPKSRRQDFGLETKADVVQRDFFVPSTVLGFLIKLNQDVDVKIFVTSVTSVSTWSRLACVASLSLSSLTAFAQEAPTLSQKQILSPKVTAEVCYTTSVAEVRGLFSRWNDSLLTLNPAQVTANYSDDAVLLPTVSNKPRTTHAEIQDYFVHFLEKKPHGEVNTSHVKIGCNKAYDVGVYTFALTGKDGVVQHVRARYSFVYEYKDGQWLISHHHSSAMPEAIASQH